MARQRFDGLSDSLSAGFSLNTCVCRLAVSVKNVPEQELLVATASFFINTVTSKTKQSQEEDRIYLIEIVRGMFSVL